MLLKMSAVSKVQSNLEDKVQESPKRSQKFTAKGLSFQLQTWQEKRSAKNKQAKRLMEDLNILMESKENSKSVASLLSVFIQCYQDAKDAHDAFTKLPLPLDELKNQNECFANKMSMYCEFTDRVECWLRNVGHPYVSPSNDKNDKNDDLNPEDSASNISRAKSNVSKTCSQASRISSTASVRLKAEADKAALLERVAALDKKHEIEAEEERIRIESEKLKRKKEQLELQTQLAAANAKIRVLDINSSQCGSKVSGCSKRSDGMNSYLNKSMNAPAQRLNPRAEVFVQMEQMDSVTTAQQSVVRPRQKTGVSDMFQSKNTVFTTQTAPPVSVESAHMQSQISHQPSMIDIMQRQNDITSMLVQQNMNSVLSPRNIPVFDGDPLQYKSFIRAFENGVEIKNIQLERLSALSRTIHQGAAERPCSQLPAFTCGAGLSKSQRFTCRTFWK